MLVSVIQADNTVVVDGVGRTVDLTDLDPRIHAITWKSERLPPGRIEYDESATEMAEARDFEAELAAAQLAKSQNQPAPTAALYKLQTVQMAPRTFEDWTIVRPYHDRWVAAAPALPPPPTPAELAAIEEGKVLTAELDDEVRTATIGSVTPKTLAELRKMRRAAFRAWFIENYSTIAQIRALVGWILFQLVRRF